MPRKFLGTLAVFALLVSACSGGAATESPAESAAPSESAAASAEGGQFAGETITVGGAFVEPEASAFQAAVAAFEAATGATVEYTGSKTFEQDIQTQVQAGNPPDVALIPQPGVVRDFAKAGSIVPMSDAVIANIDAHYGPGWKELATVDGKVYGVFHRVNSKGNVFYPKAAFEAKGYTVPTTFAELQTLMDKMVADGTAPWCVGLESGAATGWAVTDWVEEMILRQQGPDYYDKWVSHQVPFTDAGVKKAVESVGAIMKSDKYTYGGPQYAVSTNFGDAPKAAFDDPAKCWFTNQGNFITGFFPDAIKADLDNAVGVFPLPATDPAIGAPALVGGDTVVAFKDSPAIQAFLAYLATPQAGETWQAAGGALFPYKDQDLSKYSSALDKSLAEGIATASSVRFDGSDAMPGAVGAGTFWTGMVDYISGAKDLDAVLKEIDASWPAQ